MADARLPALLHLCDSLFPTGGYAHSDGLEAATASGFVRDAAGVRAWMFALLEENLAHAEGPAVWLAFDAYAGGRWDELRRLDDELHAQRPSAAAREASRAIGTRLLKTWLRLHPDAGITAMLAGQAWTLPVAFAAACAAIGVDARQAVESFLYTRLAAAVSASMRLMPLGQVEAHVILGEAIAHLPRVCDGIVARRHRPASFAPLVDLMSMRQQYVASRLFRS